MRLVATCLFACLFLVLSAVPSFSVKGDQIPRLRAALRTAGESLHLQKGVALGDVAEANDRIRSILAPFFDGAREPANRPILVAVLANEVSTVRFLISNAPEEVSREILAMGLQTLDYDAAITPMDISLVRTLVGELTKITDVSYLESFARSWVRRVSRTNELRQGGYDRGVARAEHDVLRDIAYFMARIGSLEAARLTIGAIESTILRRETSDQDALNARLFEVSILSVFSPASQQEGLLRRAEALTSKASMPQTNGDFSRIEIETYAQMLASIAAVSGYPEAGTWLQNAAFTQKLTGIDREVIRRLRYLGVRSFNLCHGAAGPLLPTEDMAVDNEIASLLMQSLNEWITAEEQRQAGNESEARYRYRQASQTLDRLRVRKLSRSDLEAGLAGLSTMTLLHDALFEEAALPARWLGMAIRTGDREDAKAAAKAMLSFARGVSRRGGRSGEATAVLRSVQAAALATAALASAGWLDEAMEFGLFAENDIAATGSSGLQRLLPLRHVMLDIGLRLGRRDQIERHLRSAVEAVGQRVRLTSMLEIPSRQGLFEEVENGIWPEFIERPEIYLGRTARSVHLLDRYPDIRRLFGSSGVLKSLDLAIFFEAAALTSSAQGEMLRVTAFGQQSGVASERLGQIRALSEYIVRHDSLAAPPQSGPFADWVPNANVADFTSDASQALVFPAVGVPNCLMPSMRELLRLRDDYPAHLRRVQAADRSLAAHSLRGAELRELIQKMDGRQLSDVNTPLSLNALVSSLHENETVVFLVVIGDRVWTVSTSKGQSGWNIASATTLSHLRDESDRLNSTARTPDDRFQATLGYEIFDILLRHSIPQRSGTRNVVVFSGENLDFIPWELLVSRAPEGQAPTTEVDWLDRSVRVSLAQNLNAWLDARRPSSRLSDAPAEGRLVAIGDPRLSTVGEGCRTQARREDGAFPGVAAMCEFSEAADMVERIGQANGSDALRVTRDDATKRRILSPEMRSSLESAGTLLFVTHGLTADEAFSWTGRREAGLVLTPSHDDTSSGVLFASEIAGLRLNAGLVILIACDTGQRSEPLPGSALRGLSDAFFLAGARSVIVTRWAVDPRPTSLMTRAFSRELAARGGQAAIEMARMELRQDPRYAHPSHWGAFRYLGLR